MRRTMSRNCEPHVSIVTPMHNTAEHVAECIESVLAQTYSNWDYVIVNNCCTDGSGEIARKFAGADSRIRIVDNEKLLPAIANHNHALRQISPDSRYCKVVFSDDWLFSHCLEEMVAVAETYPTVGIVGAYGLQGADPAVKWAGLRYPSSFVDGRTLSRRFLLEDMNVFGTAHSVLYRSDMVRQRDPFFNVSNIHCDLETNLYLLREWDFGFVHQVLTFTRERTGSLSDFSQRFNTYVSGKVHDTVKHGPFFLTDDEYEAKYATVIGDYYNYLANCMLIGRRDKNFWNVQKQMLAMSGVEFSNWRLFLATLARCFRAFAHPMETLKKLTHFRKHKHYNPM